MGVEKGEEVLSPDNSETQTTRETRDYLLFAIVDGKRGGD